MAKGYIDAIKAIRPEAKVGQEGDNYEGIIWFDETPIDKTTLDTKLAELPTENVIWDNTLRELKPVERNKSSSMDSVAELREVNEGPLNYIMGQPSLRCAWTQLGVQTLVVLWFHVPIGSI